MDPLERTSAWLGRMISLCSFSTPVFVQVSLAWFYFLLLRPQKNKKILEGVFDPSEKVEQRRGLSTLKVWSKRMPLQIFSLMKIFGKTLAVQCKKSSH